MADVVESVLNALLSAREQLEGYERDATGESYNDTQINAAIETLRARLSQAGAGGVVVKPLEWKARTSLHQIAETPFGSYSAYVDGGWSGPASSGNAGGSFEEGRAAAQADYSARIMSALAPTPSVGEPVRCLVTGNPVGTDTVQVGYQCPCANCTPPAPVSAPSPAGGGIYIASKTTHGPRWEKLRSEGVPIVSTWIDEYYPGATEDWADLWVRCIREAATAKALILYREPGETLKGAWLEAGAALARGVPVFAIGIEEFNARHHPGITHCATLDEALSAALSSPATPEPVSAPANGEVVALLRRFVRHARGIMADLSTAHSNRGPGASSWMREDDRDQYEALEKLFAETRETLAALSNPAPGHGEAVPVAEPWFCGGCGQTDPAKRCLGCLHGLDYPAAGEKPAPATGEE